MLPWIEAYHSRSRGFSSDPPALAMPRVLVGSCYMLTPSFIETNSITHVLNCAYDDIVPAWIKQKLHYKCLNMEDTLTTQIAPYTKTAETILDSWLRTPTCKCVFIHCQAGVNRSATIAAAYASKKLRVPTEDIMKKMLKQRPCMFENESFVKQLLGK